MVNWYSMRRKILKYGILAEAAVLLVLGAFLVKNHLLDTPASAQAEEGEEDSYIKWVDFNVTATAMQKAYDLDVETYGQPVHLNWIELLAYLGTSYGGDFSKFKEKDLEELAAKLRDEKITMDELTQDREYYSYYLEAYTAVLGGLMGEYELQVVKETESAAAETENEVPAEEEETEEEEVELVWESKYGLKAFNPIARGYEYGHSDDFGNSRSYGYKRKHLGHDMMGQVGTPIIAIESGYVEAIGWNQYGGWRLGIRSFDGKRYYYYAHLRQNFPYNKSLEEGSVVTAGDVIGYMGHTGYSTTENANNIKIVHLHWGLQLIFDESQKEGANEIWVDCYELTKFLSQKRSTTVKNEETKEYSRVYQMKDPAVEEYEKSVVEQQ